jgi:hypothetical protein
MKKPIEPIKPFEYKYKGKTERVDIYSDYEYFCDYPDEEEYEEQLEADELRQYYHATPLLRDINLQHILDLIPEGLTPKDIKIGVFNDANRMSIHLNGVNFYYVKTIPPNMELYKKDLEQYDLDFKKYEEDLKKYNEYEKQLKIKELEKELSLLKNDSNRKVKIKKLESKLTQIKKGK